MTEEVKDSVEFSEVEDVEESPGEKKDFLEKWRDKILKFNERYGGGANTFLKNVLTELYEAGEDPLETQKSFNCSFIYTTLLTAARDGNFEKFEELFYSKGIREFLLRYRRFSQELYDVAFENENLDISDFLLESVLSWEDKTVEERELIVEKQELAVEKYKIKEEAAAVLAQVAKEAEEALLEVIEERDNRIVVEEHKIMKEASEDLDQIMKESEEALLEVIKVKEERLVALNKSVEVSAKEVVEEPLKDKTEKMSKQECIEKIKELVCFLSTEHPETILVNAQERPLTPLYSAGEVVSYESSGCIWKLHILESGYSVV